MAGNTALALQYPVGSSNEALRAALVRLVDVLRTIQTDADQSAAINALEAEVSSLETLTNTLFDGLSGDVTNLTSGLGDLTADLTSLSAEVDGVVVTVSEVQSSAAANAAAIVVEQGARASADSAIAANVTSLTSTVTGHTADIAAVEATLTTEQATRASADSALASSVSTLSATVSGHTSDISAVEASLVSEQATRASADSAIAANITTLSTTVDGHTAELTEVSTSIDGVSARWGVGINVDGQVTGLVRLDGDASESTFTVVADKFLVGHPTNTGIVEPMFGVGVVDGATTVGIKGNALIDGSVLARSIQVDSLSAISADLGTVTIGEIVSPNGETYWNLATGEFYSEHYTTLIGSLETAMNTADTALNQGVADVLAAVGLVENDVAALQSNQLTSQERFEIALDHAIDTVRGSRAEFQQWITEQMMQVVDMAMSVRHVAHDNTTKILEQHTVRVTERDAFAQTINTVQADLAQTNAQVETIETAYVTGDLALADQISTVATTASGNTTAISTLSTSVNGISAQWGVTVSTNGNIIGAATLSGSENVSSFNVVADKFGFALTNTGTPTPFFTAGNVNGTPTSVFTGTLIGDGTIIGRHILAGEITAGKIAAGAVTADKISAASLSAITANIGTATAGVLQSADGNFVIDLNNKTIDIVF